MDEIELKPPNVCHSLYKLIALSLVFFNHHVFSSAYETRYQYGRVLPHSSLLALLLCLGGYEQGCIQLLKVLHKCCNMDMLRVLLIYPLSPSGTSCIYVTGLAKIDHLSAKNCQFLTCLLYHNLTTIFTTAIKSSSLLQNLMGVLLQLMEMG